MLREGIGDLGRSLARGGKGLADELGGLNLRAGPL